MQTTSALYQQIIAEQSHYFEKKVSINNVEYGEDKIFSLSTDANVFKNGPEVGKAVAAEIDLTILKPDDVIPRMAQIIPYIRACTDSTSNPVEMSGDNIVLDDVAEMEGDICVCDESVYLSNRVVYFRPVVVKTTSEWLQMGVFYIDTRETTKNNDGIDRMTIHGYDAMLFAEADYPSTSHAWPYSDINVVREIASTMNVTVDPRTTAQLTAANKIQLPSAYTMRETLGHIACSYAGNFVMSYDGKLLFIPLIGLDDESSTVGDYLVDENGNALMFGIEGWYILV